MRTLWAYLLISVFGWGLPCLAEPGGSIDGDGYHLEVQTRYADVGGQQVATQVSVVQITAEDGDYRSVAKAVQVELDRLHAQGIQSEVVLIPKNHSFATDEKAKQYISKKLAWVRSHNVPILDGDDSHVPEEAKGIYSEIQKDVGAVGSHILMGVPYKQSNKLRVTLSIVRGLMLGAGAVGGSLLLAVQFEKGVVELIDVLRAMGVGVVAGTMSGVLQYFTNPINLWRRSTWASGLKLDGQAGPFTQLLKTASISMLYLIVLRFRLQQGALSTRA